MEKLKDIEKNNFIALYFKNLLIAVGTTVLLILFLAIILSVSNISDKYVDSGIIFISGISILISSFCMCKKIKQKGIIHGLVFGICYMSVLYIISSFVNMNFIITFKSIIMLILSIIFGIIGGIIGVNIK